MTDFNLINSSPRTRVHNRPPVTEKKAPQAAAPESAAVSSADSVELTVASDAKKPVATGKLRAFANTVGGIIASTAGVVGALGLGLAKAALQLAGAALELGAGALKAGAHLAKLGGHLGGNSLGSAITKKFGWDANTEGAVQGAASVLIGAGVAAAAGAGIAAVLGGPIVLAAAFTGQAGAVFGSLGSTLKPQTTTAAA